MSKVLYEKILLNKAKNQIVSLQEMQQQLANGELVSLVIESDKNIVLQQNSVLEKQEIYLFVEQNAVCTLLNFESNLIQSRYVTYHIVLEQDAQFYMHFALMYTQQIDYEISVYAKGSRAQAHIKGLYALADDQKAFVKTYQYHDAPDTQTEALVKGMLKDQSQAEYKGLIVLDHGSEQAIAGQENKNIVMSKRAKIVSVPSIEVLQHNVQCSHGSAIGKFDKQAEWYLQSKGLSQERLKEVLIQTFFDPVLEGSDQKDEIVEALCKKMV